VTEGGTSIEHGRVGARAGLRISLTLLECVEGDIRAELNFADHTDAHRRIHPSEDVLTGPKIFVPAFSPNFTESGFVRPEGFDGTIVAETALHGRTFEVVTQTGQLFKASNPGEDVIGANGITVGGGDFASRQRVTPPAAIGGDGVWNTCFDRRALCAHRHRI